MSTRKVVLVDDDIVCRYLVKAQLVSDGYDVIIANDGAEALMLVATIRPDVVLLNLGMQNGIGLLLLRELKRSAGMRDIPVFVMSGKESSNELDAAFELGADDCIFKPFGLGGLGRYLHEKLSTPPAESRHSMPLIAWA